MIRAVIFDLDGTLVDSFYGYVQSFNNALKAMGFPQYRASSLKKYYGQKIDEIMRQLMKKPYVDKEVLEGVRLMHSFYESLNGSHIRALPGVVEIFRELHERKIPAAVASSASRIAIDEALRKIGISGEVNVIMSGDDIKNSKPHPEIFLKAAEKLKIPPKDCLVFEDSPHGVLAAKAAGMKCIAVATGTTSKKDLKKLSPYKVIGTMDEAVRDFKTFVDSIQ